MSTTRLAVERPRPAWEGLASHPPRLLVVDDEDFIREILARKLRTQGYICDSCENGEAALRILETHAYDLVLADLMKPGMGGIQLIKECRRVRPEAAVILVTSTVDLEVAVDALKHGAYDYVTKPFSLEEVTIAVARALEKRRLVLENQRYQRSLEEQVASRTKQLKEALDVLQTTYHSTLLALGTALDSRDADKGCHSLRVTMYTTRLARQLGIGQSFLRDLEQGALLHDIGKIGVPDAVLRKPGKLDEKEWSLVCRHPEIGFGILSGIKFLQGAAQMVLNHHERYDGKGYPNGLRGDEITLGAQIFAVADTLDCMTSDRPFQPACSFEAARDEIQRCAGTQFAPNIVCAFLQIPLEEWRQIRRTVEISMGVIQ